MRPRRSSHRSKASVKQRSRSCRKKVSVAAVPLWRVLAACGHAAAHLQPTAFVHFVLGLNQGHSSSPAQQQVQHA